MAMAFMALESWAPKLVVFDGPSGAVWGVLGLGHELKLKPELTP